MLEKKWSDRNWNVQRDPLVTRMVVSCGIPEEVSMQEVLESLQAEFAAAERLQEITRLLGEARGVGARSVNIEDLLKALRGKNDGGIVRYEKR